MYCPRCATQNSDDTKFCRSCGANLMLVPQALTGQLPREKRRRRDRHGRGDEPASLEGGITKVFMGVGFVLVAAGSFFFAPAGHIWWFWLLIPAFAMLGRGVAELVSGWRTTHALNAGAPISLPGGRTGEFHSRPQDHFPPPSVTEDTTRQLDPNSDAYQYRDRNPR